LHVAAVDFCQYYCGSHRGRVEDWIYANVSTCGRGVCVLLVARPLFAQKEWIEVQEHGRSLRDQRARRADAEIQLDVGEYDSKFPQDDYRWQDGPNRYSMRVVDYSTPRPSTWPTTTRTTLGARLLADRHSRIDFQWPPRSSIA